MNTNQPETLGLNAERLSAIRPALQPFIDRGQVAGLSTLIARRGKIAHMECQGLADIQAQRPVTPDTIWRIYSMSKPITAVAALMLYERGLYSLYDPISEYIPAFKEPQVLVGLTDEGPQTVPANREITIKDLFTHTSGLTYGWGDGDIDKVYAKLWQNHKANPGYTTAQSVDLIASLPLAFQPGDRWLYSLSIDVLGRLVEVLSGQSFGAFLQQELFEPLGMTDSGFWVPREKRERFAALYNVEQGLRRIDSPGESDYATPPAFEGGGGGLVSSLIDYARFAQMLANGGTLDNARILGRKTVELMAADHLTPEQRRGGVKRGYSYGLGVRTLIDLGQSPTAGSLGEFGWDGAASTWFCVDPAEELIAVLMIQMMPYGYYPVMPRFQALAYAALE